MAKLYFYYAAMNAGKSTTPAAGRFQLSRARHGDDAVDRGARRPLGHRHRSARAIAAVGAGAHLSTRASTSSKRSATELKKRKLDCILVDEAQFLSQRHVLAAVPKSPTSSNIPVALLRPADRFPGQAVPGRSAALLALADTLVELKAVCECGRKATMNLRVDAEGHAVVGRRADRDRRQRPLHRALPQAFLRAPERGRSAPAEPRRWPGDEMLHGWIILDKPVGLGSTTAVSAVKRILREAASRRPRSAMAARSTRWRAASCRSRSAKRPSSPAGCSTRPRPMSSPSASARRPTRSTPKGEVDRDQRRPADPRADRSRPAALHRRDRADPASLFGAEDRRQSRPMPGPAPARTSR